MLAKKFVNAKTLPETEITKRIDTFYMFGRIDQAEYEELMGLIETVYAE